jgi:hypothetical protein
MYQKCPTSPTQVDSSRLRVTRLITSRVKSSRLPFKVDLSSRDSTFRVTATLVPTSEDNVPVPENNVPSMSPSSANLPSPSTNPSPAVPSQQIILRFNDGPDPSLTAEPPFKKLCTGQGLETKTKHKPCRCGQCVHVSAIAKAKVPATAVYMCWMAMMMQLENIFRSHSSW